MCDSNTLNENEQQAIQEELNRCAEAFGGVNYFLQLLEAIRKTKPHPLVAKNSEFKFSRGKISWDKVIFNDKLSLLMKIRVNEEENNNLLPAKDAASFKKTLNLLRTLKPIEFKVFPKNRADGEGFSVHAFDIIDDETTRLNPIFDALFFCAVDSVKKSLSYTPKA